LVELSVKDANFQRGEITLVVSGAEEVASTVDSQLLKRAVELLAKELPPGRAASIAAQLTGASRSEAYDLLKGSKQEN
jgi:16S rRNA (cytidine1402-2'-O)-methyltransferase